MVKIKHKKYLYSMLFLYIIIILSAITYAAPWYNLSNYTDKNTFVGTFEAANEYTNYNFGIAVYMGFFMVMLLVFAQYNDPKSAFAGSSFLTSLVGIVMLPLNIIPPFLIIMAITGTFISVGALYWDKF